MFGFRSTLKLQGEFGNPLWSKPLLLEIFINNELIFFAHSLAYTYGFLLEYQVFWHTR